MTQAMRFDVNANDNASATFAKIAAAAERLEEKLKDLNKRFTPTVKLAGIAETRREVASLRRDFDKIRDIRAKVRVSVTGAAQVNNLSQKLERLDDARVSVHVSIEPPGIETRLQALNGLLKSLKGRTEHTVEIKEKGAAATQSRLGGLRGLLKGLTGTKGIAAFTGSLIAVGGAATAATAAVGGLVAAAATLGGALVATGPILLAGAGMIGGVLATIKVGTQGLGMAFEALAEGDMKNWGKALANLSPEAQKFALAIKDVWGALRQAKGAVQDNLFQGMGEAVTKLARVELPVLKQGMGAVATELNTAAKSVMEFVGSSAGIARQQSMWASTATVVRNLSPWLTNVTAAMFDIGEVGGRVLADITSGAGEAGAGFRKMVADARESGQLEQVMRRGVEVLRQIGSIAGNVGSILGSVFKAAQTAGADFLTTLERGTAALAAFLSAGAGQTALVDFFRESRATLDALGAGLVAAAGAAARFVSAFSNTGGLAAVGTALSALMIAVAPLAETLGRLAGESLRLLAESAINLAAALTPIVAVISGVVSAMGPLAPLILASVLAFKGLTAVSAGIAAMGVAASGAALKVGVYTTAVTGSIAAGTRAATAATVLGTALRGLSLAIPIIGVALVAATALFGTFGAAAKASAEDVANGSATFQQSVQAELAALRERKAAIASANIEGAEFGSVHDAMAASVDGASASLTAEQQAVANAEAKWAAYRATLTPFAQLQADVTRAQGELNDAIASGDTAAAAAAADRLSQADARLKSAQDQAADAAKTHADRINELSGAMQSQIGSALAYEEAVKRTADAHKAADEALKANGASSEEFKATVLDLAQAQQQQAQSAQRAVEAQLQGADANVRASAGLQAYNLELLKLNDGSAAGQAAFVKLASGLSQTGLDALSATAKMTGLKTEVLTLPDGKTVTVVTSADTGSIDTYKQQLDALVAQQWVGTVTVVGDPTRVNDTLNQVVTFANGQTGTITLDGNSQPVQAVIGQTKYTIDATTGVLTIDGNPAPGEANLSGLKLKIDQTTGTITLEGNPAPAQGDITALEQPTQSEHTVEGNPAPAEGAITGLEQPSSSTHTVNPEAGTAQGAIDALKSPTSSTHTIIAEASSVINAKVAATTNTSSTHTFIANAQQVIDAKLNATANTESLHTIRCNDDEVTTKKSAAEQPTQSEHTIHCNDDEVTTAKANAKQPTSSTHTIHVVVTGAQVPRAAGAYTTPRAEGAYAAPMAVGGMRKMSASRAEIVPPRQPRLIGDRMEGDELFLPINRSARSRSLLKTGANRMGYDVVPRGTVAPDAMLSTMRAAASQRPAAPAGGGLKSALQELNTTLRELEQGRNGATVNNNFYTDLRDVADDVARNARRQHALGLFG